MEGFLAEMVVQGEFHENRDVRKIVDQSKFNCNQAFKGLYAIGEATKRGDGFLVSELLEKGADPTLREADAHLTTALECGQQRDRSRRRELDQIRRSS